MGEGGSLDAVEDEGGVAIVGWRRAMWARAARRSGGGMGEGRARYWHVLVHLPPPQVMGLPFEDKLSEQTLNKLMKLSKRVLPCYHANPLTHRESAHVKVFFLKCVQTYSTR